MQERTHGHESMTMEKEKETCTEDFIIADHHVRIIFRGTEHNNMGLLTSFLPFRTEKRSEKPFFQLTVDDDIRPIPKERRERIRTFDTGNGDTIVDLIDDGGYQYIIKDIKGKECCLLIADKEFSNCRCALAGNHDMRLFGLNNALMLVYSFAGSKAQTIMIHASLVRHNGFGYAFTAKSGTGKSTHVNLWLQHIPGCDLMNDDNPIIRMIDGEPYIYGGPWSGKTPCYRNVKARLGAVVRVERAAENSVERLKPVEAFVSTLPSCSSMKWDKDIFNDVCNMITKLVETSDMYILRCRPDKEAALICHQTIAK